MKETQMPPVIVSACLLGVESRYDGSAALSQELIEKLRGQAVIPVCPEQMGGLPTPRCPAEITEGSGEDVLAGKSKVLRMDGLDVTANYIRGAEQVGHLAEMFGVKKAYLKAKSPACGAGTISRNGRPVEGTGVCASLLAKMNVKVISVDSN
jgi:uncharacterized protein YbbK (DUF523 family)